MLSYHCYMVITLPCLITPSSILSVVGLGFPLASTSFVTTDWTRHFPIIPDRPLPSVLVYSLFVTSTTTDIPWWSWDTTTTVHHPLLPPLSTLMISVSRNIRHDSILRSCTRSRNFSVSPQKTSNVWEEIDRVGYIFSAPSVSPVSPPVTGSTQMSLQRSPDRCRYTVVSLFPWPKLHTTICLNRPESQTNLYNLISLV